MIGYKVFYKGLVDRYGGKTSVGSVNKLSEDIKWNNSGFHFCSRPEDCLRYIDAFNREFDMTIINATGSLIKNEDEYYGYYDMYVTDEYTITSIMNREDMIREVVESRNVFRVMRLVQSMKLTEEEISYILSVYPEVSKDVDYYQYNKKDVFELKIKKN